MPSLYALLVVALSSSLALAQQGINAFAITNSDQFNSAAQSIVSQNVPSSIQVGLGVAIQSAASSVASITSGDINSLVQSALTAETPAPFLTALPSQYQSNVHRIEFEISSLREAVSSTLTITRNITTMGNVTMLGNTTLYANSTLPATAAAVVTATNFEGSTFQVTVSATFVNASSSTPSATGTSGSTSKGAGGAGSTSKSSAFAMPTQIPVAAAGVVGVLGLLAAL